MIRDYITYEIQEAQPLIEKIKIKEQSLEDAKAQDDRNEQDEAKKVVEQAWKALIDTTGSPSAIYHFLDLTKEIDPDAFRATWQKNSGFKPMQDDIKRCFETLNPPKIDNQVLSTLPEYSFVLQFTFTLAQPYISRDEQDFYIIDNPVRKDKVFGFPYAASTSWKGSLRAALWQSGYKEESKYIYRLFGNNKEEEDQNKLHAGRLYFFPTFFDQKSLEVINPQNRKLRAGDKPILFESVPANSKATGAFTLLFVPFDRMGMNEKETRDQVAEELKIVAQGIHAMFRIYGFGAKTSSGFGLAREDISGSSAPPPLPRYLEKDDHLRPEYLTSEGTFRERSEAELKKLSKGDRQLYEKAKGWWERRSKEQTEATKVPEQVEPASPESLPPAQPVSWPKREFNSFEQLTKVVEKLAEQLKDGSEETQHE